MDKASIVGDAIEYVRDLQQQVKDIELEIADMETKSSCVSVYEESGGSMADSDSGGNYAAVSGVSVSIDTNKSEVASVKCSTNGMSKSCLANSHGRSILAPVEQKILEVSSSTLGIPPPCR